MATKSGAGDDWKSTKRITKSTIDATPLPPSGKRTTLWDTDVKGFGLRLTASGVRTYILRYRMGGRDTPIRTVTIGQHGSPWTADLTRKRAIELLTQVRSGRDFVAERDAAKAKAQFDEVAREDRMFARLADS